MPVKDIMTKKVVTVTANMEIEKLAKLFVKKNISGAPVVDKKGKLLGLVREEGLIFKDKKVHLPTFISLSLGFLTLGANRYREEFKKIAASKVADIMEKDVVTVSPDTDIDDLATMMIETENYYFPVVEKKKLVGVITKKDIVRAIAKGKA